METPVHEPEVVNEPPVRDLELRQPGVPTTLNDLAARKGEGVEIIQARQTILETVRRAAIRMTSPEDWVLYKSPEEHGGQTIGYLQDCGADRVRDLYGIEIFSVSVPEKVNGDQPGVFHYLIRGSGRCKLTRQILEEIEGGRSSTDDFCKDKKGIELELAVRKAARANLDGNITRELAGLKSVPIEEIEEAWKGTPKKTDRCRKGRGFGTAGERLGGSSGKGPDVEPPKCGVCGAVAKFRDTSDGGFYGCPNYKTHADRKWSISAPKWIEQQKKAAAAASAADASAPATSSQPQQNSTTKKASAPQQQPLTSGDIFGSGRQPGEDG